MAVQIDVVATREGGDADVPVTSGLFTFVALDEAQRPRPLPPEASADGN